MLNPDPMIREDFINAATSVKEQLESKGNLKGKSKVLHQ